MIAWSLKHIQEVYIKNVKCHIIQTFCFKIFFLSTMSAIYLKSYHGILEFQLNDKEQKVANYVKSYFKQ